MENDVNVREIMTRDYAAVNEGDSVLGAVQVMREDRAGFVLVMRGEDPVGIVTEWDVLCLVADEDDPADTPVGDVMSSPLVSLDAERGLSDATSVMARENIRHVLAKNDDDEVVGVLTQRDVISATGSRPIATNGGMTSASPDPTAAGTDRAAGGTEPAAAGTDERVTDERVGEGRAAASDANATFGGFERQGICEECGAFAETLWERQGKLLCEDCSGI
jgi:CBS domain-containing protein